MVPWYATTTGTLPVSSEWKYTEEPAQRHRYRLEGGRKRGRDTPHSVTATVDNDNSDAEHRESCFMIMVNNRATKKTNKPTPNATNCDSAFALCVSRRKDPSSRITFLWFILSGMMRQLRRTGDQFGIVGPVSFVGMNVRTGSSNGSEPRKTKSNTAANQCARLTLHSKRPMAATPALLKTHFIKSESNFLNLFWSRKIKTTLDLIKILAQNLKFNYKNLF